MKILILKPSSLGDVIHALPVLRLLRLHFPDSRIHWWIESSLAEVFQDDPDVSGIYRFDRQRWWGLSSWARLFRTIRAMRRERFDFVIDLQGLGRSALIAWLANGETTIGLDNPREGNREGALGIYDIRVPRSPQGTHAVDRYLSVLPLLGVPLHQHFDWLPRRESVALRFREKWPLPPGRWVMLLPGARWNNKRWPAEKFAETTQRLSHDFMDLNFGILGGRADREVARTILSANPARVLDLTGQTSVPEMIEWIRLSNLVITNDTGPMHVAAALRKPLVAIFGPTDPASTGPYGQRNSVFQQRALPCVPCMKRACHYDEPLACLQSITPEQVVERARSLLEPA